MTTIVVIQCGSAKLKKPARAKDLYTGQLFKAARRCAERLATRWYIASAKHGLLGPERIIAPYDAKLPAGGDEAWSERFSLALARAEPKRERLIALVSKAYARGWAEELGAELPLAGIGGPPTMAVKKRIQAMEALR